MENDPLQLSPEFTISRGVATYADGEMVYLPLGPLGPAYSICSHKKIVALVFDYIFLAGMFWCVYVLHLIGRPFWWAVGIPVLLMVLMRTWIFPTLIFLPTAKRKPEIKAWYRRLLKRS